MSDYIDNDEVVEKCLSLSNQIASDFRRSGVSISNGPALVEELAIAFLKYAIRPQDDELSVTQRLKAVEFSVESFTAMIVGFKSMKESGFGSAKEKEEIEETKKEMVSIFRSTNKMINMILEGSDQRCSIMIKLNKELAQGLQATPKSLKR